jgi:hypothetical protein
VLPEPDAAGADAAGVLATGAALVLLPPVLGDDTEGVGVGVGVGAAVAAEAADSLPPDAPAPGLPPSRKSVTYQPEPLSWKPAAVTCFSNDSA